MRFNVPPIIIFEVIEQLSLNIGAPIGIAQIRQDPNISANQKQELARQTHFRGYYLLNADIINLTSSATGDFAFSAESAQINPNTANYSQGLRISRSGAGCGLTIGLSSESGSANRGLRISADGNSLTFNGSVIAGTGATNGASNGSVNYSAGNPILWGLNSVDTNGGFYSNGNNVYWRAHPLTMGSVPP
ncbi:MAG: hypothetical protein EZS28_030225 [Streblomastix strix]|uniref:Uncharacterized protein n=1 Tax=Streblomastix strix TaxID=222440 RepID=A0A5J4UVA8_9EUKA|nr:MAG: hypothetical protein EZS28_030225 [Streblomastix strix]